MKKVLSVILAVCLVLSMTTVSFAAYGEHEHQLMKMANMNSHYEECQVCFELFNVGEHTFKDGKCTVCGHPELVNPFVDVKEDAWYYRDVVSATHLGIINGKTPDTFAPDDYLTYAEAIKLAACMNQRSVEGKVSLVNGTPWYQTYVDYCFENNIISKAYSYDSYATRAGYIEIFANALSDEALKEINYVAENSIPDVPSKLSFAPGVYKLYRAGILQGVDLEYNCNPYANIKRGEVSTILVRMMDEDERLEFSIGEEPDEPDEPDDIDKPEDTDKPEDIDEPEEEVILPLEIVVQPEGCEAEEYGVKHELYVEVKGGKEPYTYEWQSRLRKDKYPIENGDYVKDAGSEALTLSIEKENTLLGANICCVITDAEGNKVTTNYVRVFGPFSMPIETSTYGEPIELTGRIADGIIRKGDKVSILRGDKVISVGTAIDLQAFGKSLEQMEKGIDVAIMYEWEEGTTPQSGDTVIKYQPYHVVDTSDIIN